MQNQKYISGMVMYTIQNENLRKAIHTGIAEEFKSKPIDQSTYEIPCAGDLKREIEDKLKKICELAEEVCGVRFQNDDFVVFYRATNSDDNPNRDRIERIPIIGR